VQKAMRDDSLEKDFKKEAYEGERIVAELILKITK
jgi:hypothetical protein